VCPNAKAVLEDVSAHDPFSDPLALDLHVRAIVHVSPCLPYLVGAPDVGDKLDSVSHRILDKGL
jgi:hypothetical protein